MNRNRLNEHILDHFYDIYKDKYSKEISNIVSIDFINKTAEKILLPIAELIVF